MPHIKELKKMRTSKPKAKKKEGNNKDRSRSKLNKH